MIAYRRWISIFNQYSYILEWNLKVNSFSFYASDIKDLDLNLELNEEVETWVGTVDNYFLVKLKENKIERDEHIYDTA